MIARDQWFFLFNLVVVITCVMAFVVSGFGGTATVWCGSEACKVGAEWANGLYGQSGCSLDAIRDDWLPDAKPVF